MKVIVPVQVASRGSQGQEERAAVEKEINELFARNCPQIGQGEKSSQTHSYKYILYIYQQEREEKHSKNTKSRGCTEGPPKIFFSRRKDFSPGVLVQNGSSHLEKKNRPEDEEATAPSKSKSQRRREKEEAALKEHTR